MSTIINEFVCSFLGGTGNNGQIKESLCRVRLLANGDSEFKYLGKMFGRWQKLIPDLANEDKYPFAMRDLDLGGECKSIRIYNFSMQLEEFRYSMEHSSLKIVNNRLKMKLREVQEKLATATKQLNDLNFEDRRKKGEIDNSKHQKALRSNLLYNENVGGGIY